jgi:5'-nucleotidase
MIIYIDMDGVLCDFNTPYQQALIEHPEELYPQSIPGFFINLTPFENAIESVKTLALANDVYFLSAPSVLNPHSYTEKRLWIEKYLGIEMCHKLILTPNKGLNKGDILIDDEKSGRGQESFEGTFIHFGKDEFSNWEKVKSFIEKNSYLLENQSQMNILID